MNCQEVEILLSSMLDRKLSPEEEQAVTGHVDSCEKCRTTLAELRKVVELLSSLPAESCPRVVADHLRDAVMLSSGKQATSEAQGAAPVETPKAEPVTHSFFLRYKHFVQIAVAAAAVLLIVLGNVFIFDQHKERIPSTETAFDRRDRSKETPAGKAGDLASKAPGTLGEMESKDGGVGYTRDQIGKGGALEDALGQVRQGESQSEQQVKLDGVEEVQKLVEEELGKLAAEKDLEAGKEEHFGGRTGGGDVARNRRAGQGAAPVVALPVRTVVITTAAREASRQRVDEIVLRTLGEAQKKKLVIAGKPAAPSTVDALEKKTKGGADAPTEQGEDASPTGDQVWDADRQPVTGLSWQKAAPAKRALREASPEPGDGQAKSGDNENIVRNLEEKSDAYSSIEPSPVIFLAVEVNEAEAALIMGRLHAEALVGAEFASSLDVVPDDEIDSLGRSLGFIAGLEGAADAPGASPQTAGAGAPAEKAAGEESTVARRELADKEGAGGLAGEASGLPAVHESVPETAAGADEFAKTPDFKGKSSGDERGESLVADETKPVGEALKADAEKLKKEAELRLPPAEPKLRRMRLVIVLLEKSEAPAK
ncbi:MAG: zf-HC2 domain-containing protein [Planctomycetota bacterium]|nr:zf-HC2 domain-containing protein [Planctomycetota bacterium]